MALVTARIINSIPISPSILRKTRADKSSSHLLDIARSTWHMTKGMTDHIPHYCRTTVWNSIISPCQLYFVEAGADCCFQGDFRDMFWLGRGGGGGGAAGGNSSSQKPWSTTAQYGKEDDLDLLGLQLQTQAVNGKWKREMPLTPREKKA